MAKASGNKVEKLRRELKAARAELSAYRDRNVLFDRAIRSNDLHEVGTELYRYFFKAFGVYKGDITILADYDERELYDKVGWAPRRKVPEGGWFARAAEENSEYLRGLVEDQVFAGYGAEEERLIRRSRLLEQSMLECMLSKKPRIVNDVKVELSPREVEEARRQKTRAWLNWVVLHPDNAKVLAKLHMSFRSVKNNTFRGLSRALRPFEDLLRYRILHTRDFKRVKFLSERDALTGFFLRPVLAEKLEDLLEDSGRSRRGLLLSVGMIDLDFFKRFNDEYGHDVGDRVLRRFSQAMQSALRGSDIVGRYGGEEFVALFPQTSARDAVAILSRVHERIKDTDFLPLSARAGRKGPERLRFSAGIVTLNLRPWSDPPTFEEVIKSADELLLRCKDAGRNRCRWRDAHGHPGEHKFGA